MWTQTQIWHTRLEHLCLKIVYFFWFRRGGSEAHCNLCFALAVLNCVLGLNSASSRVLFFIRPFYSTKWCVADGDHLVNCTFLTAIKIHIPVFSKKLETLQFPKKKTHCNDAVSGTSSLFFNNSSSVPACFWTQVQGGQLEPIPAINRPRQGDTLGD